MDIAIRRARGDEAEALTRVAHAAKRYWGYPEAYIQLWKDDLTVTPDFVERQAVFCAVQDAKILGFYALSGEGTTYELVDCSVSFGTNCRSLLFRPRVQVAARP